MFPLSCTQAVIGAHTRKLGAHSKLMFLEKNVLNIISYTSFQIQMSAGKMLHKGNFMPTQTLKN